MQKLHQPEINSFLVSLFSHTHDPYLLDLPFLSLFLPLFLIFWVNYRFAPLSSGNPQAE